MTLREFLYGIALTSEPGEGYESISFATSALDEEFPVEELKEAAKSVYLSMLISSGPPEYLVTPGQRERLGAAIAAFEAATE